MVPPSSLDERLGVYDECDTTGSDQQPRRDVESALSPCESHETSSAEDKRLPRGVTEIASLQAELVALMLQLKQMKQVRSTGVDTLLTHGSYWRTEAKYQSKQRAEAQQENERLRAQLQAQKKIALRFVNTMKRRPIRRWLSMIQTLQMLDRYERATSRRARERVAEFDQPFANTNSKLAAADLLDRSSILALYATGKAGSEGSPSSFEVISEAVWRFRPHQDLQRHFIYDHIKSGTGATIGYTCRFQPKESAFPPIQLRSEYLQRLYTTEDRVVIVWKFQVQTVGFDSPEHLHVHGLGYYVVQNETANGTTQNGHPVDWVVLS